MFSQGFCDAVVGSSMGSQLVFGHWVFFSNVADAFLGSGAGLRSFFIAFPTFSNAHGAQGRLPVRVCIVFARYLVSLFTISKGRESVSSPVWEVGLCVLRVSRRCASSW